MANTTEGIMISHSPKTLGNKKIQKMIAEFGMEGYGMFWATLEVMSMQKECKIEHSKGPYVGLAASIGVPYSKLAEFLKACVFDYKILKLSDDKKFIYSDLLTATPENAKRKLAIDSAQEFYEKIWSLYPEKKGKSSVSITRKLILEDYGLEQVTRAIERYKEYVVQTGYNYKMGSTFFTSGIEDYLDESYEVTKNTKAGAVVEGPKDKILKQKAKLEEVER